MDENSSDHFTPEPVISNQNKLMACRNCGHLNPRTARFCSKCGERFGFASYAQAYAQPVVHRLGWIVLLAIPAAVVCLLAFSFIAGGLGYGNAVRSILNIIFIGIGVLGLVIVGLGILLLTHKRVHK